MGVNFSSVGRCFGIDNILPSRDWNGSRAPNSVIHLLADTPRPANHTSKRVNSLPREERSRRPQAILGLDQVGSKDFPA